MRSSRAVRGDIMENVPFCSLYSTVFGCRSLVTVARGSPPQWALQGTFTAYISAALLESTHLEDFKILPCGGGILCWLKIHPAHVARCGQGVSFLLSLDKPHLECYQSGLPRYGEVWDFTSPSSGEEGIWRGFAHLPGFSCMLPAQRFAESEHIPCGAFCCIITSLHNLTAQATSPPVSPRAKWAGALPAGLVVCLESHVGELI